MKQKLFILSGIIGPIIYFLLLTILGALWTGYNPITQSMSEIGGVVSPYKNIMNVFGFSLLGIFIALFAFGFKNEFKDKLAIKIGFMFLLISGAFMFLVGFFPCDAGCIDVTATGRLHSITSTPPSIFMPLAAIFAASVFTSAPGWGKKWGYASFILGILSMSAGPIMFLPSAINYMGLIQRIGIGLSLIWMFVVALKIFILNKNYAN